MATVSTYYRHLEVRAIKKADSKKASNSNDSMELDEDEDSNSTSVRVDLRLLSLFLGADHIAPKSVLVII